MNTQPTTPKGTSMTRIASVFAVLCCAVLPASADAPRRADVADQRQAVVLGTVLRHDVGATMMQSDGSAIVTTTYTVHVAESFRGTFAPGDVIRVRQTETLSSSRHTDARAAGRPQNVATTLLSDVRYVLFLEQLGADDYRLQRPGAFRVTDEPSIVGVDFLAQLRRLQ